jgi:hypothetical protein
MAESTAPSRTRTLFGAIFGIVVAIGAYLGVQMLFSKSPEQKAAELSSALSELAAKENPAAPKDMGDGLMLLSAISDGKAITYTFLVPEAKQTEVRFGGALRDPQLQSSLCATPLKALISAGAGFNYVYLAEGTKEELARSSVSFCL